MSLYLAEGKRSRSRWPFISAMGENEAKEAGLDGHSCSTPLHDLSRSVPGRPWTKDQAKVHELGFQMTKCGPWPCAVVDDRTSRGGPDSLVLIQDEP